MDSSSPLITARSHRCRGPSHRACCVMVRSSAQRSWASWRVERGERSGLSAEKLARREGHDPKPLYRLLRTLAVELVGSAQAASGPGYLLDLYADGITELARVGRAEAATVTWTVNGAPSSDPRNPPV